MGTGSHINQSLHYLHSLALQSRTDFSHLPNVHPDTCSSSPLRMAESLLPSVSDDQSLRDLFKMQVSRVLYTTFTLLLYKVEQISAIYLTCILTHAHLVLFVWLSRCYLQYLMISHFVTCSKCRCLASLPLTPILPVSF